MAGDSNTVIRGPSLDSTGLPVIKLTDDFLCLKAETRVTVCSFKSYIKNIVCKKC